MQYPVINLPYVCNVHVLLDTYVERMCIMNGLVICSYMNKLRK